MNDMMSTSFDLDSFRRKVLSDPLVQNVWDNKYRWKRPDGTMEQSIEESQMRVIDAICANDPELRERAFWAISNGYFLPAGRINAGAGTGRNVTLLNCYVNETIQDSMPGIQRAIAKDAFTLQQGGGVGSDFSTVRPAGALVSRTGSVASGAIAFMDQRSAMSDTVCSAGERRGAMMTVLADWHPDLWREDQFETITDYNGDKKLKNPSFISVKRQKGRLTQTNISVLVSDAFMKAIEEDADWDLGFWVPRADGKHVDIYDKLFQYNEVELDNDFNQVSRGGIQRTKGNVYPWYVYTRVKARRIWNDIMESTYKYAEPGVIFIDRVNDRNNLKYVEDIRATNPCGEQPLPPYGCCCLGSVNLAFMVKNPFTDRAEFDELTFLRTVRIGIRFLDNVLDVTAYPLDEQRNESMNKRRIGLGMTGVADALVQLGVRYGSEKAQELLGHWTKRLQLASYAESTELARIRGAFPLCNRDELRDSHNVVVLSEPLREKINMYGLRNGVLNTIAPNGTISIYSGNTAQGIEPVFSFEKFTRKVRQPDGSLVDYQSVNYSRRMYEHIYGPQEKLPDYFVGALDLSAKEHVQMQAACQQYIDASISKTVNCAPEMTFDEFKSVYILGYDLGCKGLTTYRPDPDSGRGSVLSVEKPKVIEEMKPQEILLPRSAVLQGRTYKLKWPKTGENWYVTVNRDEENHPVEVFIIGGGEQVEWVQAMARLLTAVLRRGGDVRFLVGELTAVHSVNGGSFISSQHAWRPSVAAAIGGILQQEFKALGLYPEGNVIEGIQNDPPASKVVSVTVIQSDADDKDACPNCRAKPLVREEGCVRCLNCDYTKCG